MCDVKTANNFYAFKLYIVLNRNIFSLFIYSRKTKVGKMLTLAPQRYIAEFCMVAKVIIWCI